MKRLLYLLLALMACNEAMASPGDTTWVQANITQMPYYGSYDSSVIFPAPGKTYRAIYMIFTLGKYVCPGSPTYCGDWDYTIQNYLIVPNGPTLELGRLISPYANAGAPRTPWSWTQNYVYDVTDYAPLLHDSAVMRIFYSGYTGGFTASVKFAFIEGTPDHDVLGIKRLWNGSFGYGGATSINTHFPAVTDTAPENSRSAALKFTVTGHGSDNNYCNEFCPHNYYVYFDGAIIDSYTVWRPDCGMNELYPQSGTWLYQRANWCPGAIVYSERYNLPHIASGTQSTVDIQFDPYSGSGGASYTTEAQLFYYGEMKKLLDASIDYIIAPTNDANYFRENPTSVSPAIHIKNRGSAPIDSVRFVYGLQGVLNQSYTWHGTLNSFQETDVTFPPYPALKQVAGDTVNITGDSVNYKFTAKIVTVNGSSDADSFNNTLSSNFVAAPVWPSTFKILLLTNNEAYPQNSDTSETSWIIYDANNNIVRERAGVKISQLYIDTVTLPTGSYRLQLYDSSCDGLQWWANAGTSITSGYFNVRKLSATVAYIPMKGYYYSGTYNNDFGCGFTQYFSVNNPGTSVTTVTAEPGEISAYPNPAQNVVHIDISANDVQGTVQLVDALGRTVVATQCMAPQMEISVASLANGVYTIVYIDEKHPETRLTTRLLIVR